MLGFTYIYKTNCRKIILLGLFRKRYFHSSDSLSRQAWKRFAGNRLSLAAFTFILLAIVMALLAYLIVPDPTPSANRQIIEIAMQKPGFKATFLKVRKNENFREGSFLSRMISGRRDAYKYFPVQDYTFHDEFIRVEGFTGEDGGDGLESRYLLADVLYAIRPDSAVLLSDGRVTYTGYDGQKHSEDLRSLQTRAVNDNLVTKRFLLGTDQFGRDYFSRLVVGTRVSLSVGLIAVFISLTIGLFIGSLGGFFRGWIDQAVMWLINVVWSIPTLLLVIAITFALGKGFWQVFLAVGLTMWVEVARVARGQILGIREKEYAEAARALGFSHFRIITRHILPNIMGPVIVISAANFASAILIEAGLSFLGIGIQPPAPSWGSMIRENYPYIILDYAYLAVLPGLAIMLLVLAFMIVGNGLRDALDVRVSDKPVSLP